MVWWKPRKTIIQHTTCIILRPGDMQWLEKTEFYVHVKQVCVYTDFKQKHCDICSGVDELHCGTTDLILDKFSSTSPIIMAFQKALIKNHICTLFYTKGLHSKTVKFVCKLKTNYRIIRVDDTLSKR